MLFFQFMLMSPPSNRTAGFGPARRCLSLFFRLFGQVVLLICDALMIYRMVYSQSYHVIVSVMCPVFHLGVLKITLTCDAALKSMTDGMIDVPIAQPVLLRKVQSVISILNIIVLLFMVVLFVIWTPLTQAHEGTALFDLSSLHRLWLTDVMGMYAPTTFPQYVYVTL